MGVLRVYRDIYRLNFDAVTGETYTLINVASITASSFIRGSLTAVETLSPTIESTGIYFVELNPSLYTFSDIYEVRWSVQYIVGAPTKVLTTRFRMNPVNIAGTAFVDVIDNQIIIEIGDAA